MEGHTLHQTLVLAEGVLRPAFAHLVDDHLEAAAIVRHHTRQVVAFPVPRHLPHGLQREERESGKLEVRGQSYSAVHPQTINPIITSKTRWD